MNRLKTLISGDLADRSGFCTQVDVAEMHKSGAEILEEHSLPVSESAVKQLPVPDVIYEDGAEELLSSPSMSPYVNLMLSEFSEDSDMGSQLNDIAALPLEKRYVWRIASALKWGFADFSSINVDLDRETMSVEDLHRIADLVCRRPAQLCLFLKALVGVENMERMMQAGIAVAKLED